jgi:hypothetical protein
MDITEISCRGMDRSNLAQDKQVAVSCEHGNNFQVHSMWGASPIAAELLASQE